MDQFCSDMYVKSSIFGILRLIDLAALVILGASSFLGSVVTDTAGVRRRTCVCG